jgi:hypothetical protein
MAKQIEEKLREHLEADIKTQAEQTYGTKLSELQGKLEQVTGDLKTAQENELSLRKNQEDLQRRADELDLEVARRIDENKKQWEADLKTKTQGEYEPIINALKEQLQQVTDQLNISKENEKQLLKKQGELDQKEKDLELEVLRQVNVATEQIRTQVNNEAELRIKEKEKQLQDAGEQINQLKQKLEQGSQQLQGEVAELKIEEVLKSMFPYDTIEPVPKGIKGADVIQKVFEWQNYAGTIIWESKRTKAWDSKWIDKLKQDQIDAKSDIAILMTAVLPKGIDNFSCIDGVWVTDFACAVGLAAALRQGLIEVARTKIASQGKNIKMEMLYDYLSGPEFRQKIVGILETFDSMKSDLDKEKRAMEKLWKQREKQIDRVY